jgi:hypothetical protein
MAGIEAARVAMGTGGDLHRLRAWLNKKVADHRIISANGFTTVEMLFRSPEKSYNMQQLCNAQRKNFGFSRGRSTDSFAPMSREDYGELSQKAVARERVCLCERHDQEAFKMVTEKPATQWCPQKLDAYLDCYAAGCKDPAVSPLCTRLTGYRRVGLGASYIMYLELASQCASSSTKVFGVMFNLAMSHPHIRDCIERSDFDIREKWKDYSDTEGSDAWRTADSTPSNPHPKRKQQGRLHPMARPGRKKQRTH